jgi:hypothetical protein
MRLFLIMFTKEYFEKKTRGISICAYGSRFLRSGKAEVLKRFNLDARNILFVGRFIPDKGISRSGI